MVKSEKQHQVIPKKMIKKMKVLNNQKTKK